MSATGRLGLWLALSALCPVAASAQDVPAPPGDPHGGAEVAPPGEGEPLPTGHPPIDPHAGVPGFGGDPSAPGEGDALPSGHPPVAGDVPPGPVAPGDPMPSGHPPVGGAGAGAPPGTPGHGMPGMGGMGDAAIARMFAPPETATAEPDPTLPPGSIRIVVVDENDAPVADAEIQLGIMRSAGGDRDRLPARSGPDGTYLFEGLDTGSGQAYRVNVLYEGATYSSTPFQLPPDSGYSARVRRLPVAHDERQILQFVAQVLFELRDDRLHVIVQSQLVNIGDATYVFPGDGIRMRLPDGFVAFQSQAVMTDQHVEEQAGYGLRIRGSLPPGSVTLAWGFDVPTDGDTLTMRFGNPFRTMRYRVISEAPEGLAMDVEGFPRTRRVESDGQTLLATELQRRPGDESLDEVTVRLRGIPGPGPLRLVALGLALVLLLGGALRFARRPGAAADASGRRLAELGRRKDELLAAARALEAEHAAGEIGDVYRQKRRDAIVNELAGLLYREERLREAAPVAALAPGTKASAAARGGTKTKAGAEIAQKPKKKAGSAPAETSGSD